MPKNQTDIFLGCDAPYDEAEIVMFGAPFDGTTSFRAGARFGPKEVRANSFGYETYSPYQDADICERGVFDSGDLELPFGNTEATLHIIEDYVTQIINDNKVPVMIGGEHLVTLGAIRALATKYPGLCLIHLDAHTDLRDDYLGETLSHATVMRRIWDIVGDNRIYQYGVRSGEKDEFAFACRHTVTRLFDLSGMDGLSAELEGKPVYLTLDMDVLDPSHFPGTGTPEPGGVSFKELLNAILSLKGLNIVGCDVVELSPHYDHSGISTAAVCKIIREILLILS